MPRPLMSAEPWQEIGDRVYRRNFDSLDLNVGLILSDEAALVIDSRATHGQADELIAEIEGLTRLPVRFLVNTHHHWDHTFGNARFRSAEIVGHSRCRRALVERGEAMREGLLTADWLPTEAKTDISAVEITPPESVFEDQRIIVLGDREVSLSYLGRGHTDNDIVTTIDEVVFAGDLVEEGGPPQFGDAFPRQWVETLRVLSDRVGDVVVPGHGDVVDREFVIDLGDEMSRAIGGEQVFPDVIMSQLRDRLQSE